MPNILEAGELGFYLFDKGHLDDVYALGSWAVANPKPALNKALLDHAYVCIKAIYDCPDQAKREKLKQDLLDLVLSAGK